LPVKSGKAAKDKCGICISLGPAIGFDLRMRSGWDWRET